MTPPNNHKNLGRGLAALFGEVEEANLSNKVKDVSGEQPSIPMKWLRPGKQQPRRYFDSEKMESLKHSIQQKGVLQPILVRKITEQQYEIVAGERRWRAAVEIGLGTIPIKEVICTDEEALEIGLIENLQRDDLNPMEESESLQRLLSEHNKTQEQIAITISKSRSYVANMLRLNGLPENIKILIREGKLSAGHAKSIAAAENIDQVAAQVINDKLTVRDTENLVRKQKKSQMESFVDPDIQFITENLGRKLGLTTKLNFSSRGGALTFYFESYEQLDGLISLLSN